MLGLGQNCLHPQTQKPYIKSAIGGKNNSPEGHSVSKAFSAFAFLKALNVLQGDSTHGFIMMFESKEDRDYYINEDPVHKAFVQSAGPIIASVRVVDFADGVF